MVDIDANAIVDVDSDAKEKNCYSQRQYMGMTFQFFHTKQYWIY